MNETGIGKNQANEVGKEVSVKRILGSPITKGALLTVAYIMAVFLVTETSVSFRAYMNDAWLGIGFFYVVLLFVVCTVLYFVAVWVTPPEKRLHLWHMDLIMLAALGLCLVLSCLYFASSHMLDHHLSFTGIFGYTVYSSPWLLFYTAFCYGIVMLALTAALVRLKEKPVKTEGGWRRFFTLYPATSPFGFVMALMLCINFFVLLLIGPILGGSMNTIILFMVISSTMVLALDYFRSVVLALAGEYDRANEEKIRAERFKTELITNVSHDIRTPLTALISYVDLLKGLPVEHEGFTEYVGVLEKKSARLKTLIDDLMEASKATTGNVGVNLERVDLAEIVGQIAGEFEEQFAERDLALVFPQPSQPVFVQADSRHLWRALENLFANVVKYALPKTRVFADIALRDDGAWFTLKNTSQSPIELSGDALTEQFIRGDRARQTEGSGLGLYIAKSLMELMGGDLTIHTVGDLFEAELRFG